MRERDGEKEEKGDRERELLYADQMLLILLQFVHSLSNRRLDKNITLQWETGFVQLTSCRLF